MENTINATPESSEVEQPTTEEFNYDLDRDCDQRCECCMECYPK